MTTDQTLIVILAAAGFVVANFVRARIRHDFIVSDGFAGLLYHDGKLVGTLAAGRHVRWNKAWRASAGVMRPTTSTTIQPESAAARPVRTAAPSSPFPTPMTALLTNLAKLNSLTKYPSIATYHALGDKGRLTEAVNVPFEDDVILTEKIDGTNARLICTPEGVLVGSREDLLWATGDLIHNPAMGIVAAVRDRVRALLDALPQQALLVIYGEVYGRNVGAAAKNYTSTDRVGFRVFDAFEMPLDAVFAEFEKPAEVISRWRENGGQPFLPVAALDALARERGLERVPALGVVPASLMPQSIAEAAAFLAPYAKTSATLDETAPGHAEGVVARSMDRHHIAKLRFEDYRRTLKR